MAVLASNTAWLQQAFLSARDEFFRNLPKTTKFDFSKLTTVDDVYRAAKEIEREQKKTKSFRGLKRIEPFINVLKEYSGVIDTFVQVKPDIMGLIWGPLKFLLQAASTLTATFGKIVKVLGDVGLVLPSFKQYATLFPHNDDIRRVLCLFFEDILSIFTVLLNFSANKGMAVILEPLWPNIRSKIDKILENIEHHKSLMAINVTLEDISLAQSARRRALEEYDRAQKFREHQTFSTIRSEVLPVTHHEKLADILEHTSEGSGEWLRKDPNFSNWMDPIDRTTRCLWLCGIPGAGKTYLAGNTIRRLQKTGQCSLFAFISHDNQRVGNGLHVLISLLFQALEEKPSLQPILPDSSNPDHKRLTQDQSFVKDLLCTALRAIGPTFIVLDGLDEVEESSWKSLLTTILDIMKECVEVKVLISCREVRGIALVLGQHATPVRVDKNNHGDIQAFVQAESRDLLVELESCGATKELCSRVQAALDSIAEKSDGMFLYARLVLHAIKDYKTLPEIQSEVENLPDGLDEAYGRLILRIERKVSQKLREVIRSILMWIACAGRPLRVEELLQILVIDVGKGDFTRGRKDYRDICKDCGPIIEVVDGVVRFVHFSAEDNHFLKLADAHLNAALTCTTYLSYTSLDTLFSGAGKQPDVMGQVLDGDYVFLEYAALEFMHHIKAWIKAGGCQDTVEEVAAVLRQLFMTRANPGFDGPAPPEHITDQFGFFGDHRDLRRSIASAEFFLTGARVGMIEVDETTGYSTKDPLTILSAVAEFRRRLENMVCDGRGHTGTVSCKCQTLETLYGPRLYHCTKPFCNAYVCGFQSKTTRDQHLNLHSGGFKCPEPGCIFADTGFRSKIDLSRHTASAHTRLETPTFVGSNTDLSADLPPGDKFLVLQDAVMNSQFDAVRRLVTEDGGFSIRFGNQRDKVISLAAWHASPDLLQWLLEHFVSTGQATRDRALHAAIESENLPNIALLLSRGANIMSKIDLSDVFPDYPSCGCHGITQALRRWNGGLMRFLVEECGVTLPLKWDDKKVSPALLFRAPHLSGVSLEDARNRFAAIKPYVLWKEAYALGPTSATEARLPSVLRVCLENGGDPNSSIGLGIPILTVEAFKDGALEVLEILLEYGANPNGSNEDGLPLHRALDNGRREMVKLLLQYGADPNKRNGGLLYGTVLDGRPELVKLLLQHGAEPKAKGSRPLTRLSGMKKIEGYFGARWEDIVRRIQAGEDLEGDPKWRSRQNR